MLRETHQDAETEAGLREQATIYRQKQTEKKARVLRLRRLDMTSSQIARQVRMSETTVNEVLRANGLQPYREPSVSLVSRAGKNARPSRNRRRRAS